MFETKAVALAGAEMLICGEPADPYLGDLQVFAGHLSLYERALRTMPPDAVVVDVGANIGLTVALAGALLPQARIIALEPSSRARACLERTIAANGLTERVTVIAAAAGREAGTVQFAESSSLAASHVADGPAAAVPMVTVDGIRAEMGLDRLDLLKIDVEGWELDVIEGAWETLAATRALVVTEMNAWMMSAVRRVAPRVLLDHLGRYYNPIAHLEDDGTVGLASTESDLYTLLHRAMFRRGCVDDLAFSADPLKVQALHAATRQ